MRYLKFTYVDAVTGVSVADSPAKNGPAMPSVDGLQFVWARESQYPTLTPELFGTCPDTSDTTKPGVMAMMDEAEWLAARQRENADQRTLTAQQIADRRWRAEVAGIDIGGIRIDTGRDSQALITGATVQAMLDPSYALRWKTPGGFVDLTAEQIIGVATAARAHVQNCFNREAELLNEVENGTFEYSMLEIGWPE